LFLDGFILNIAMEQGDELASRLDLILARVSDIAPCSDSNSRLRSLSKNKMVAQHNMSRAAPQKFHTNGKATAITKDKNASPLNRSAMRRQSFDILRDRRRRVAGLQSGADDPTPFQQETCHGFR
jgi:hypothetical protein